MPSNEHGQPIGEPVPEWTPRERPAPTALEGHFVRLDPVSAEHAQPLFDSLCGADDQLLWTYRSDEAPSSISEMARYVAALAASTAATTYAVVPTSAGEARGLSSLMRDDPANGVIEVGAVIYARELQRTPATTEATYLLAKHVFDDLGYRRFEWKLDSLNEPSAAAARRLGFSEEGVFRQHMVYKGRNRDTLWFAMTDADWPGIKTRLEAWLSPNNFDEDGRQRSHLGAQ